jgi:hypothetical protein
VRCSVIVDAMDCLADSHASVLSLCGCGFIGVYCGVWRFVWLKFGYNDAAVEFNKLPAVLNVFAQP